MFSSMSALRGRQEESTNNDRSVIDMYCMINKCWIVCETGIHLIDSDEH